MSNLKVLIIEDEVLIAEHLKHYLVSFGFGDHHYTDVLIYKAIDQFKNLGN